MSYEQVIILNAALAELSSAIISPVTALDEVYLLVLDKARLLTQSQHGFVSSIDPKTDAHVSNTLTEMRKEGYSVEAGLYALPDQPHHLYNGLWGHSLNIHKAFFTNSPASHSAATKLPTGHLPLKNFLSAPVMFADRLLGQIALANSSRDYTDEDVQMIRRLAELYAVVLHNRWQENELRSSEERFRLLVQEAPLPLVVTRLTDHTVLYANQLATESFGIVSVAHKKISDYFVVTEERIKLVEKIEKEGLVRDMEIQLQTISGQVFWAILSATKVEWFGETAFMVAINDISVRKLMEQELHQLATIDVLTDLLNRRQFFYLGSQEVNKARRYRRPLSFIIYDLDHFKAINDNYGHQAGDYVLQQITAALHDQMRDTDIWGRVGGEEFSIFLPETEVSQALLIGERLRATIEHLPIEFEGTTLHITASFGVTEIQETDKTPDPIFKRADEALYESKAAGRNCVSQK